MADLFTKRYRPSTLANFIGNQEAVHAAQQWLSTRPTKGLLLTGPVGVGKSLLAELLLDSQGYNVLRLEESSTISKKHFCPSQTMDGHANAILAEEGEVVVEVLTAYMKAEKNPVPVIAVCANRYDTPLKPILPYCTEVKLGTPSYQDVYRLLYQVVTTEKMRIKEKELKEMYEEASGDIRSLLNALQLGVRHTCKNLQMAGIFESTGCLLSLEAELERKYDVFWSDPDMHLLMIQENYPAQVLGIQDPYRSVTNLAMASAALSDADWLDTRTRETQAWELSPYVNGMVLTAASKCNRKSMLKFPQYLGRLSTWNKHKLERVPPEKVAFFHHDKSQELKPSKRTSVKKTPLKTTKRDKKVPSDSLSFQNGEMEIPKTTPRKKSLAPKTRNSENPKMETPSVPPSETESEKKDTPKMENCEMEKVKTSKTTPRKKSLAPKTRNSENPKMETPLVPPSETESEKKDTPKIENHEMEKVKTPKTTPRKPKNHKNTPPKIRNSENQGEVAIEKKPRGRPKKQAACIEGSE